MQHDFFGYVMPLAHQHHHHTMPIASSMAPLHLFSQDNQNEVPTMTLVLASHDVNGTKTGFIAFHSSRKFKRGDTTSFCYTMLLTSTLASHDVTGIGVVVI